MHECFSVSALLLGLCVQVPAAAANESVARFAIVIGNNQPDREGVAVLRYADDDALATQQLLTQADVQTVLLTTLDDDTKKLNPEVKPQGRPTKPEIERSFAAATAWIQEKVKAGIASELLLFYSGHGDVRNGEGYVVLEGGGLSRTELYSLLSRSAAAHNHVLIDACRSYFLAFEKGPGGRRQPFAHSLGAPAAPAQLANTGFVLSTSSDRDSHEWERLQSGILSHEIRSALRGAADVDQDGRVTYAELGAFIQRANREIPNSSFRPDVLVLAPGKDLGQEVLRWKADTANVVLSGSELGHVYVENARGSRILDAHPAKHQPLTLHLPNERPLFVRRYDGQAEYVVESREPVVVASLLGTPQVGVRGAIHLAFEKLFALPFEQRDVREFEREERARALQDVSWRPPPPTSWQRMGSWSSALAIGGAAGALSLGLVSLGQYYGAPRDTSQLELQGRYSAGKSFMIGAIVVGSVAAAAGLVWGATRIWPDAFLSGDVRRASLSLGGSF